MSQFNFEMMDSAGYGYYRVWTERAYLFKLALIPFLIKFACMVVVLVLGLDTNILRQGLVLLPGDIAEGWVLGQFLRTLLKGERWPTILPSEINDTLLDRLLLRARGIVAATLVYALVSLVAYFIRFCFFYILPPETQIDSQMGDAEVATAISNVAPTDAEKAAVMNPLFFVPIAASLVIILWSFRLMWLYIPFSVLMPMKDYLKALGGMMASVKMMVLSFCCMAPIMFLMVMLSNVLKQFTASTGDAGQDIVQFVIIFMAVVAEVLVGLVTTAAFVWAMRGFLPKNPELLKELPKLGGDA